MVDFGLSKVMRMRFTLSFLFLCCGLASRLSAASFADIQSEYGTTTQLIGVKHTVTTNPDGTGINFWLPDFEDAMAVNVSLSNPHMAGADAFGNVYIADKASHSILKITPDGVVHTFAGTHEQGFSGDGPAQATSLKLDRPNGLFVFADGTVFLLDPGNHRIRRVGTDGIMTTVVNDPDPNWYPSGRALWVRQDEALIYYTHEYAPVPPSLIADGATLKKWTPQGGIETVCSKAVGFRNPANLQVNPVDGRLYATDRAEEETTGMETGLYRIDGPDQRTRITGDITQPKAAEGQLAIKSYIEGPRGLAFLPDGSYFLCAHKDGNVWFVDTDGVLHLFISGSGKKDTYIVVDDLPTPLLGKNYMSQPRAVTVGPNGDLYVVCNDSGYCFKVHCTAPPAVPSDLSISRTDSDTLHIGWKGVTGRGYRIEHASTLESPVWSPVGAVSTDLQGAPFSYVIKGLLGAGASSQGFYRVVPSL